MVEILPCFDVLHAAVLAPNIQVAAKSRSAKSTVENNASGQSGNSQYIYYLPTVSMIFNKREWQARHSLFFTHLPVPVNPGSPAQCPQLDHPCSALSSKSHITGCKSSLLASILWRVGTSGRPEMDSGEKLDFPVFYYYFFRFFYFYFSIFPPHSYI